MQLAAHAVPHQLPHHPVAVLLGMGLDEFSMTPNSILKVRRLIRSLSYEEARGLAEKVLRCATGKEIEDVTRRFLDGKMA